MSSKYALRPALVAGIISLTGCATTPEPVGCPPLPLPPRPELPIVQPDALACLSDAAYEALATRDAKLQAYAGQMKAVILTTRDNAEN